MDRNKMAMHEARLEYSLIVFQISSQRPASCCSSWRARDRPDSHQSNAKNAFSAFIQV